MAHENNTEVVAAAKRHAAAAEAHGIRNAVELGWQVYALDARDGKEYRIVAASTAKGVLMGQEPRQGIWFPVSTWVQR